MGKWIKIYCKWQIIYYPLFRYLDGKFTSWNNLDKYCSFTDVWINGVEIKKLFALRNNFSKIFIHKKKKNLSGEIQIYRIFLCEKIDFLNTS